jgi:GAF domain-containing protein
VEEKKEIQYFQAFFDVSRTLLSSSSLKEMLHLLVKRTVQALGVKAGSLRLVDEKTNRLELVSSHLLSRSYLNKGPLNADQSIPEVLKGHTVLIKNAFEDPRIQYRSEKIAEGINTILSVPVMARDKAIGVLRLYTAEQREFNDEQIEFAAALAEMGGLAIANARIYEKEDVKLAALLREVGVELPKKARHPEGTMKSFALPSFDRDSSLENFRALREINTALLSSLNSREIMDLILDKLVDIFKVKGASLRLVNETTRELELLASKGLSAEYLRKGPVHLEKSMTGALAGEPVYVSDARNDPRIEYPVELEKEGIASILSVPITAQDRIIGVLRLYSAESKEYSEEEVAFLSVVAEIAGIAIINARFYERTKYDLSFWKTTVDYLTS